MQTLVSQSWAMEKPHVNVHVGDLEWWATQQSDEPDLTSIWYSEDELVGWAWLSPPAELDVHLHPDHRRGPLYELMLDWFETSASSRPAPPDEAIAFLFEPARERVELMESRGYRPTENGYIHNVRSLTNGLPEPTVPDGFSLRHVQGREDIEQRVAVHQSAFAPSRMTSDRYRTVMASAHYRPD